jgi:hypothetical protein
MAILQISEVNDSVVQLYAKASAGEQRQLARVVEEMMELLKHAKESTTALKLPTVDRQPRRNPFRPFPAIKLTGEGPTASEMVIQGRR